MRPDKGEEQVHEGKKTGSRMKGKKREREPYNKEKKRRNKSENSRVESTPRPAPALNMSGCVGGQKLHLEALTSCMLLTEKMWESF
eukprot:511918-Rhodomonas_salina.1